MEILSLERYAPLLASLALGSLGVVSLASGRREAVWRLFATFCLLLMGATGLGFLSPAIGSEEWALVFGRIAPALALLSFMFAMLYVAELNQLTWSVQVFGREVTFDFSRGRRRIVLFGRKVSFRAYMSVVAMFWCAVIGTISFTDLLVRSVRIDANSFIRLEEGPLIYLALAVVVTGLFKINFFMVRSYRSATLRHRREYLLLNFFAFNVAYMPALVAALLFPLFDLPLRPVLFLGFPIAVVIFYLAIVRFQFAEVDQLTRGLEQKVEQRTLALRQAQVRLVQSEKMASLGQLVAGVAHELNNPVGAIRGMQQSAETTVKRLEEELGAPDAEPARVAKLLEVLRDANRVIGDGSTRVAQVVARLKSFARLDESEVQEADIREGIADVLELLRHELGDQVEVVAELGEVPPIRCYPSALNQVWMNILINAKDALSGNAGQIHVRTDFDQDRVSVEIVDTGCGIPGEDLPRIFDPGFTTKGVGVGTGLGLAICYQIVEQHGGTIEVAPGPDSGTRVSVSLGRTLPGLQ